MSKSILKKCWESRLMTIQYQKDNNVSCFILDNPILAADCVNGIATSITKVFVPNKEDEFDYPALRYSGIPQKDSDFFNGSGFVNYLPAEAINNIYSQLRTHIKRIRCGYN